MIEFYKEVARYQPYIRHERSGESFDLQAVVLEGVAPIGFRTTSSSR